MSATERPASGQDQARTLGDLPTGTVTFLFTDVEGSTRAWIRNPAAMGAALTRHDAIIEDLVAEHAGRVVRPRGEGDSRFAVFARASDGVAAACAIQLALLREPWPLAEPLRVRMALHTGDAALRTGDYYGQAVNHCARIRSVAHGAQVLVSSVTADLVHESLDAHVSLRDLGEHQLKDLERPEHIWQLVDPQLPSVFPPLLSLSRLRHNLPGQTTPFIGRQHTIEAVKGRLLGVGVGVGESVRLLTLTGPGGIGKTRLALQVAAEVIENFADGVFFVALAPIADASLMCATIARALGIREAGGRPIMEELTDHLRTRELLLVLDNFEHLMASAPLVGQVLDACPRLSVLVTSRTVLHLAREQVFEVPPLPGADPQLVVDLAATLESDAVKLFVERARAVQADFALTAQNARSLVEICQRLEGLPLAIELAAARVRLMGPEALLGRLSSRLGLLTTGPRDVPARHQTLRSAIAWSYELLTSTEQRLFERLAVFAGRFSLEAAEAVGNTDAQFDAGIAVLDGLTSLVDQSLIQIKRLDAQPAEPRFELLETIREYALERLAASGDELGTRDRHSAYFLALAESAADELRGPRQVEWLARLDRVHDNLRAALRSCVERQDAQRALRFGGALSRYWHTRGHIAEGRTRLSEALGLAVADGSDHSYLAWRASALNAAGSLAQMQGDITVAQSSLEESLAIRRTLQDRRGIGGSLNNLGNVAEYRGDHREARVHYQNSLAIMRQVKDNWGIATVLDNLGFVARNEGDDAAARLLCEESLAIGREIADRGIITSSLQSLGAVAQRQGDIQAARLLHEECLTILWEVGDLGRIAGSLESLAGLAAAEGRYVRAVRLAGAAASQRALVGSSRFPSEQQLVALWWAPAQRALHEAAGQAAWAEGQAMSAEQAVVYALQV